MTYRTSAEEAERRYGTEQEWGHRVETQILLRRMIRELPYEDRLERTRRLIQEWYEYWDGDVSVSFSGGLDSTVLLHLVRELYPDVPAHFVDTGLEWPAIKEFVARTSGVQVVRPKLSFRQVLDKYGYPIVSKRVSQYVGEVQRSKGETATKRLRLTGIKSDGTFSRLSKIPDKWLFLVNAPFKISDRCCYALKKRPLEKAPHPFLGTRVEESDQRMLTHLLVVRRGNVEGQGWGLCQPRATPIYFWRHLGIWRYIEEQGLDYADVYKGENAVDRTGCMFCMFGAQHKNPNQFQVMQKTQPKLWRYCILDLGVGEVLDYLGIPYTDTGMR